MCITTESVISEHSIWALAKKIYTAHKEQAWHLLLWAFSAFPCSKLNRSGSWFQSSGEAHL